MKVNRRLYRAPYLTELSQFGMDQGTALMLGGLGGLASLMLYLHWDNRRYFASKKQVQALEDKVDEGFNNVDEGFKNVNKRLKDLLWTASTLVELNVSARVGKIIEANVSGSHELAKIQDAIQRILRVVGLEPSEAELTELVKDIAESGMTEADIILLLDEIPPTVAAEFSSGGDEVFAVLKRWQDLVTDLRWMEADPPLGPDPLGSWLQSAATVLARLVQLMKETKRESLQLRLEPIAASIAAAAAHYERSLPKPDTVMSVGGFVRTPTPSPPANWRGISMEALWGIPVMLSKVFWADSRRPSQSGESPPPADIHEPRTESAEDPTHKAEGPEAKGISPRAPQLDTAAVTGGSGQAVEPAAGADTAAVAGESGQAGEPIAAASDTAAGDIAAVADSGSVEEANAQQMQACDAATILASPPLSATSPVSESPSSNAPDAAGSAGQVAPLEVPNDVSSPGDAPAPSPSTPPGQIRDKPTTTPSSDVAPGTPPPLTHKTLMEQLKFCIAQKGMFFPVLIRAAGGRNLQGVFELDSVAFSPKSHTLHLIEVKTTYNDEAKDQLALAIAVLRKLGKLLSREEVGGKKVPDFKVACHIGFMEKGPNPTADKLKKIATEFANKYMCPLSLYKIGSGGGCLLVTSDGVSKEVSFEGF